MNLLVVIICLLFILEVIFKPRIDIIKYKNYGLEKDQTRVLLYYSIKSKIGGEVSREYLCLLKY